MSDQLFREEGVRTELKGIRRTTARRMTAAWAAPVFHLSIEVDMTEASRAKLVVAGATVTDVLVLATAAALRRVPAVNVHVDEDAIVTFDHAHIGIVVATPKGLTVPVVHDADRLNLAGISEQRRDLVERARSGDLTRDDITGGTFTISNLGMLGVTKFDAILNAPQAAIIAVGATVKRSVWTEAGAVWRPLAELTLTADHRALDGSTGAEFMAELRSHLETPLSA